MPEATINIARWNGPEISRLTADLISLAEAHGWKVGVTIDEPEVRFELVGPFEHRDELMVAVGERIGYRS